MLGQFGPTSSETFPTVLACFSGGFKLWECTTDLIETLRREIQDGRLSFRGKHVLEVRDRAFRTVSSQ